MSMEPALQLYVAESRELLEAMEDGLLHLEREPGSEEALNAVFRAAHTIKGSAGLFGLDHVESFTHVVESVLERMRDGTLAASADRIAALLACRDHTASLVDAAAARTEPDGETLATGERLLNRLRSRLGMPPGAQAKRVPRGGTVPGALDSPAGGERDAPDAVSSEHWHLSLRFGSEVLRHGMDPLSFLRYLQTKGEIVRVCTLVDRIPAAAEMDPEACYLGYEIAYRTAMDRPAIESAFAFVRDECALHIVPPRARIGEYLGLLCSRNEDPLRLGAMLVECGSLTQYELDQALARQGVEGAQPRGVSLVAERAEPSQVPDAALDTQTRLHEAGSNDSTSVRVNAEKLDQLIALVGELVVAEAAVHAAARQAGNAAVIEGVLATQRLAAEVRNSALALRMVKIGTVFSRFQRLVHGTAREFGKDVELSIRGADTELDKSVVEKINDPLTHLVRNAIDHGIEATEVRQACGKAARSTLRLNAYHDSGSVVIEVADDGRGLDRARILNKALDLGLIQKGQKLSDAEIDDLIFAPGLSTAEHISSLSGRGVGMDVVKRNITALRGSIQIESRKGAGTTVSIRLPLTLAIIDGFQVAVGKSSFILPLEVVNECLDLNTIAFSEEHNYLNLRGRVLPFVRLRDFFELQAPRVPRESLVVVQHAGQHCGIVVDRLIGEMQAVIKPLGRMFERVRGLAGSTLLGNGEVGLILDVAKLAQAAIAREVESVRAHGASASSLAGNSTRP